MSSCAFIPERFGLRVSSAARGSAPALSRISRDSVLSLSFAQQRLWFLDQLIPEGVGYNLPMAFRIVGPLDVGALEKSLTEIMSRHESLRTCFVSGEDQPIQQIKPAAPFAVEVIELSDLSQSEREAEAERLAEKEAGCRFDLTRDLLLRAKLLRLGAEEHVFLCTMHHIASDGWSMGIFSRELKELYEAFSQGKGPKLAELSIQYADFAVWQREWLRGEVLEEQLSYWREQLADLAPLQMPTDHPRSAVQSYRGQVVMGGLVLELSNKLKALGQREGVTLYMTLLAAFQGLLYRYTGQDDIAVGSPIANRNHAEIEGLIGFFVNNLVMRTDFSGDPSFRELLGRVKEVTLGAYGHQDLPFEKLVEELQPGRDLSRNPVFQVVFALQNAPRSELELDGLTVERFGVEIRTTRFDLEVHCWEEPGGLVTWFISNADLFDGQTMERMLSHFKVLLEGIVADPDQRISALPILTESEKHQLLVEWNGTKREYPKDKCIHELFEAQAQRTPDAVAVVFEDKQLTYRELNQRANQLAHQLRRLGVGPEVRVGLCVERSLEMVVGLLGILKAGGAYVPLDPQYPRERLEFMLADSKAPVLVTQPQVVEKLIEDGRSKMENGDSRFSILDSRIQVVCLDTDWELITKEDERNLASEAKADNLAYVIYTSGSTGQPKGVQVTHGSVVNLLGATQRKFDFSEADIWTVVHSYAFDFSVWEIWGCLIHGGELVVVPLTSIQLPHALIDLMEKRGVTVLNCTPSVLEQLLCANAERSNVRRDLDVRLIVCGGEAFLPGLASSILSWNVSLCNFYGPTEATVWAAFYQIESTDVDARSIPIGRPLANTQIYILDESMKPLPIGIPGELHVGGAGLARGYLNRPDLTAEKFVPNPFTDEPGARLYKTGDLARHRPDGTIEFLGRMDNQVKIRGYRIELGEIESVLRLHTAVREAVVIAREDATAEHQGADNRKSETCTEQSRSIENLKSPEPSAPLRAGKRLAAYVVPSQSPPPSIVELRSYLQQRLPEYMVPSAFVVLEALPLSPNGKVDRQALPAPDRDRPELKESFVAPRSAVEEMVAGMWSEVLGIEQIGVHDIFFDLGGHSLLATQVISRIREVFGVEIPLRCLFERPTVAGLLGALADRVGGSDLAEEIAQTINMVDQLSPDQLKQMLNDEAAS